MKIIINESKFMNLFEAATLDYIYNKYYNNIPNDEFMQIIQADPTYNPQKQSKMGKYGKWLLNQYQQKNLKLEDLYKAKEYLTYFVKYYNILPEKDINKYPNIVELYKTIKDYIGKDNIATSKSDEVRRIKQDAKKVYEDAEWLVIIPLTKEASCYYGKNTEWCTAAETSHNYFDQYNNQGPLYININKTNNKKYQFHFETDSFMDENDEPIKNPIAETIGFNENIKQWYKNDVKEGWKLSKISYEVYGVGDVTYTLESDKESYEEMGFNLVSSYLTKPIATNLIINPNKLNDYFDSLNDYEFLLLPNTYGYNSLILDDDGNLELYSHYIKYATELYNKNGNYNDFDFHFLETVDTSGRYNIITTKGHNLFEDKYDNIHSASLITSDIIEVKLHNKTSSIVFWGSDNEIDDIINVNLEPLDYGEEFIVLTFKNGEKLNVNAYEGYEMDFDENDEEYL